MTLLATIDHDGVSFAFGVERQLTTAAGLALAHALARGDRPELPVLAARYDEEVGPLEELQERLLRWNEQSPGDPAHLFDARPTGFRSPSADVLVADAMVQVMIPLPLVLSAEGYVAWTPTAPEPIAFGADEVAVLACFAMPHRIEGVVPEILPGNEVAVDPAGLRRFLTAQHRNGLLQTSLSFQPRLASAGGENTLSVINSRTKTLMQRQTDLLAARPPRNGRVPVYPVNRSPKTGPPLALGLLFAYAEAYEGGRLTETYDFVPDWTIRAKAVPRLVADGPAVFLFSDYVWSMPENVAVGRRVRQESPGSLIVHGGPNAPKYTEDRDRFFAENPEVDVLVHGEGEATVAEMLAVLDGRFDDLSVLADVPGLSYRPGPGQTAITTADRPRIAELDTIPSPYLNGMFDAFKDGATELMILESNRGCPYGCTFCDWGSATLSRIRKFDIERVRGEIEWAGEAGAKIVVVGDSNFGIFERDVEIAEMFAEAKAKHGAPEQVVFSYAKNTVKHVEKIVRTMVDGGIFGQAGISIQSFDEETLQVINRKNIKTTKYDDLTQTFRESKLPVYTDLMIGLPGSTVDSVSRDLQRCIERDVMVRSYPTQLLTNSPMNAPEYREQYQIEVDDKDMLVSTSTYTRADRREMDRRVNQFHAAESYGTVRQVIRWVAHRRAVTEISVLETIGSHVLADQERFPLTAWVLAHFLEYSVPPGSWTLFYDEVEQVLREVWGADLLDEEWATVRLVQHSLMPERGRTFPVRVELEHDYVSWSWAISDARAENRDPSAVVPRLGTFRSGDLEITDPNRVCDEQMGAWHWSADYHYWELGSPLARHLGGRWAPVR